MFDTWKIVTNHNERRILVVNGILSEEYKKELRWEDYEAIFIESFFGQASQDYQAIFSIHPLLERSAGLKPIFVTDKLRSKLGIFAEVIDGYADSPTSPSVTNKIEQIYQNRRKMGIVHQGRYQGGDSYTLFSFYDFPEKIQDDSAAFRRVHIRIHHSLYGSFGACRDSGYFFTKALSAKTD